MASPQAPLALFDTDGLVDAVDPEARAMRDTVRRFVDERCRPNLADWYETGQVPARELSQD